MPDSKLRVDKGAADRAAKEWKKVATAHDELGDWVPKAAEPTHNGGFERMPDNGSPVPYKLNGHVNIQRKLPWDTAG